MTAQDVEKINQLVQALSPIIEERNDNGGVRVSALCWLLADLAAYYETPRKDIVRLFTQVHKALELQYESEESVCH